MARNTAATVLYLLRHGATEAGAVQPPRIQARRDDAPLSELGMRQSLATRDLLAIRPLDHCYTSPLARARQTAAIVTAPHELTPVPLDELTACDAGRWEGLDWDTIRRIDPEGFASWPEQGYPEGETLVQVAQRMTRAIDALFDRHPGQVLLVVGHHETHCAYLGGLLGMDPARACAVLPDHGGVSVVVRQGERTTIRTLNATFHLDGVAA